MQRPKRSSVLPKGGAAYTIGFTTIAAIGAIIYSHQSQVNERKVMRAGVERDKERIRQKRLLQKAENQRENVDVQQQSKWSKDNHPRNNDIQNERLAS